MRAHRRSDVTPPRVAEYARAAIARFWLRRSDRNDRPALDAKYARQQIGHVNIVRFRDQNRDPFVLEARQHFAKTARQRRRKSLERFVEEQNAGPGYERACERDHFLLAAGQFDCAPLTETLNLGHDR